MILQQRGVVAELGVASGLAAAAGLTRLMSSLPYGVSNAVPVTYALASMTVAAVALLASYVPARGAAAVDPLEALRWQ